MSIVLPIIIFYSVYVIVVPSTKNFQIFQKDLEFLETVGAGAINDFPHDDGAGLDIVNRDYHLIQ